MTLTEPRPGAAAEPAVDLESATVADVSDRMYPPYYGVDQTLNMLRLFAKEVLPHVQTKSAADSAVA